MYLFPYSSTALAQRALWQCVPARWPRSSACILAALCVPSSNTPSTRSFPAPSCHSQPPGVAAVTVRDWFDGGGHQYQGTWVKLLLSCSPSALSPTTAPTEPQGTAQHRAAPRCITGTSGISSRGAGAPVRPPLVICFLIIPSHSNHVSQQSWKRSELETIAGERLARRERGRCGRTMAVSPKTLGLPPSS